MLSRDFPALIGGLITVTDEQATSASSRKPLLLNESGGAAPKTEVSLKELESSESRKSLTNCYRLMFGLLPLDRAFWVF